MGKPFEVGREKTGGRKKGTPNHATYARRVFRLLFKEKGLTEEQISVELLQCGVPPVIQKELARLQEFKYGKLPEEHKHTGSEENPIRVVVEHVGLKNQAAAQTE